MFCAKCGNQLPDGCRFCPKCGTPVGNGAPSPAAKPQAAGPAGNKPQKNKKSGAKKGWIAVLVVALFLLILAAAVFFGIRMLREQSAPKETGEQSEEEFSQEESVSDGTESEAEETEEAKEKQPAELAIRQVDNIGFPEITFYASVTGSDGESVKGLGKEDFTVTETDGQGNSKEAELLDVYQVVSADRIKMNLVLDTSDSMEEDGKLSGAKNAAIAFVNELDLDEGDEVEIIQFNDFVYMETEFSDDKTLLTTAINGLTAAGNAALLDGIYTGLSQTYYESGARCVVAFTGGEENASSYTYEDVVNTAKSTGIPVFIIGIGDSPNADSLKQLAQQCSGKYYAAGEEDLEEILEEISLQIYQEQQDYYAFRYISPDADNTEEERSIVLASSSSAPIEGECRKEYFPTADLDSAFSASYVNLDFMIPDSSQREVTMSDLEGMSLAQLRIARNEIFARHGRQFKDVMLNQWFYSKTWYLEIAKKYSPQDFDSLSPSPLSDLENENITFIKEYEDFLTESSDIFPDAEKTLLSEYDLCLGRDILQKALDQVMNYSDTDILEQNIRLIEEAIDRDEVAY